MVVAGEGEEESNGGGREGEGRSKANGGNGSGLRQAKDTQPRLSTTQCHLVNSLTLHSSKAHFCCEKLLLV